MFESTRSAHAAVLDAAWADATAVTELLDEVLAQPPSARSGSVLADIDYSVTTDEQREKLLLAWDRQLAWTHAKRAEVMVSATASQAAVASPISSMDDDWGPELVAALTGMTLTTSRLELQTARLLSSDLPQAAGWLERAEITWQMATDLAKAVEHLPSWDRETVDSRMRPQRCSPGEVSRSVQAWRRRLRREVLRVDTDAESRRQRAKRGRRVEAWPAPDGMGVINAHLSADGMATVMAGLTALADRCGPTDQRTLDQRRADALVELFRRVLDDPQLPRRQGQRPTVQVTGSAGSLLGLCDTPGELAGYGPITAAHLREIAADGDWQRFITDSSTGRLVGIGDTQYRPSAALRRFMTAAAPTCDFPGCGIPSTRCDSEHTLAHDDGGPTDPDNVRPRCRRHHRCKTHTAWSVQVEPGGDVVWTTPYGHRSLVTAHTFDDPGPPDDPGAEPHEWPYDRCPTPPTTSPTTTGVTTHTQADAVPGPSGSD